MPDILKTQTDTMLELLEAGFGDTFKAYFDGDPVGIPQSMLPCVIVEKESGTSDLGATGMDKNKETILLKVALNKKDDYGASSTVKTTHKRLKEYAEARDADTKEYLPNTLMGILRTNFTFSNSIISQSVGINYGLTPRPNDVLTAEVVLTFSTAENIIINGRT